MRRFLSGRQSKEDENRMCNKCHADKERMKKVEIEDSETKEKHAVSSRFILASDSYAMTLHGRLLANGDEDGVSCNDCHATKKDKHAIQGHNDISASTHKDNLSETCAASGCHAFSSKAINSGFVNTDMYDIDYIPVYERILASQQLNLDTAWERFLAFSIPVIVILGVGSLLWSLFAKKKKSVVFSLFGGDHFQQHMIGRKPKAKVKKSNATNKKKQQKRAAGGDK